MQGEKGSWSAGRVLIGLEQKESKRVFKTKGQFGHFKKNFFQRLKNQENEPHLACDHLKGLNYKEF